MRRMNWVRGATVVATLTMTLALTGCMGGDSGSSEDRDPGSDDGVAGRTGTDGTTSDLRDGGLQTEAINVAGTVTTVDGNAVSTACFDFTTPEIGAEWELHPEPLDCVADVNWPDADQLTLIRVRAQTGEFSLSGMEETFREAGYENFEGIESTVDGQLAYTFALEDGLGLQQTIVIIELPEGRFTVDDVPLTAIFIAGYAFGEGDQNQVQQIVDSIKIH